MLSLELFVELYAFADLTQEEAAFNEKNLRVEAKKATLEVGTKINGGNVCFRV